MWKVKDKIKFVKEGMIDSTMGHFLTMNKVYQIVKTSKNENPRRRDKEGYSYQVLRDDGGHWWIEPNSFKLIKKKLKKETDFLDAFQENFKWND